MTGGSGPWAVRGSIVSGKNAVPCFSLASMAAVSAAFSIKNIYCRIVGYVMGDTGVGAMVMPVEIACVALVAFPIGS